MKIFQFFFIKNLRVTSTSYKIMKNNRIFFTIYILLNIYIIMALVTSGHVIELFSKRKSTPKKKPTPSCTPSEGGGSFSSFLPPNFFPLIFFPLPFFLVFPVGFYFVLCFSQALIVTSPLETLR